MQKYKRYNIKCGFYIMALRYIVQEEDEFNAAPLYKNPHLIL